MGSYVISPLCLFQGVKIGQEVRGFKASACCHTGSQLSLKSSCFPWENLSHTHPCCRDYSNLGICHTFWWTAERNIYLKKKRTFMVFERPHTISATFCTGSVVLWCLAYQHSLSCSMKTINQMHIVLPSRISTFHLFQRWKSKTNNAEWTSLRGQVNSAEVHCDSAENVQGLFCFVG